MAYNPGTQYRGDAYLFNGIANAGQAAGDGIKENRRRREEFEGLAKYAQAAGYGDKDTTTTMSLPELKSFVRAREVQEIRAQQAHASARQDRVADAQVANFEADNNRAEAAAGDVRAQRAAAGNFWQAFSQRQGEADQAGPAGPNDNVGRRVSLADVGAMASKSGYAMRPEEATAMYKAMADAERPAKEAGKPPTMMKLEDGTPVVYSEQTGKWDFLPEKPDKKSLTQKDRIARYTSKLKGVALLRPEVRAAAAEAALAELNEGMEPGSGASGDPLGLFSK